LLKRLNLTPLVPDFAKTADLNPKGGRFEKTMHRLCSRIYCQRTEQHVALAIHYCIGATTGTMILLVRRSFRVEGDLRCLESGVENVRFPAAVAEYFLNARPRSRRIAGPKWLPLLSRRGAL